MSYTCINCDYRYKQAPCNCKPCNNCGTNRIIEPSNCSECYKLTYCPNCDPPELHVFNCPSCVFEDTCVSCSRININTHPCDRCNEKTTFKCCICKSYRCIYNLINTHSNEPYYYLNIVYDSEEIRNALVCHLCFDFTAKLNPKLLDVPIAHAFLYKKLVDHVLTNSLKKYDMHDRLFISYLAMLIFKM